MTESDKLIRNETEAIECLKSNKPTSVYVMLQESIDMAIKALEKQIPKKPPVVNRPSIFIKVPVCPNCSTSEHYQPLYGKTKYCSNCGQKLDWSDEE